MKKLFWIMIIALGVFILPTHVLAVDFSITNTEINAYLQENGEIDVTEEHTYQFDGDFNGISRTLIQKEHTEITDFQAFENDSPLEVEQDGDLYKIYRSGEDQTLQIELHYTIKDGIEVYSDLGQFYWSFFDDSNESTYENMDIFIHPPQNTEGVIALGYDTAYKTEDINSSGVVHFALGEVDDGTNGDIRVGYDASLFPTATLMENKTIREDIVAEQAELAEKAAAYEARTNRLNQLSPFVIAGLSIFFIILIVRARIEKKQRLHEVERRLSSLHYVPKQIMSLPATILFSKQMLPSNEMISAALLDLVRKGYVKREDNDNFKLVNSNTEFEHESILINWLFHHIGNNGEFSTKALEEYVEDKNNHSDYHSDYAEWTQAVKKEIKQHHLYERKARLRWFTAIISVLTIPFTILLATHSLFMWMFFSIVLGIGLLLFTIIYHPQTIQGLQIHQEWKKLSDNYHNISEEEWNAWMTDEQMKAFIFAVGTGNKEMTKRAEILSKNFSSTDSSMSATDIAMIMIIATSLTYQFDSADTTVSASTSTSNTSSGSGVGGGGGGSGAF
ncbi:DUF2207 domain-containing protein [Gracilibacillus sp. S3-1-1]|uniref:DUF2207 domain-containing protein n=1 Tax=Gracilibacillus pellucidus TaxID=3095368 RepID=A0ACC6M268_9BACI|nr:DUF2207 domain-containing protein [Gracilibacillus sp. S3-1-1]MDX8044975.1 DUF2207 domain-containing protein [Gracilibacillus sp. S3-1-1]